MENKEKNDEKVRNESVDEKMENALWESEQIYKSVVENIGIGISIVNNNMEILSLNGKMRELFPSIDISKKPICYKTFNTPPREDVCSYCPTYKTLQDGQVHESITETPAGDKIINFRIISSPIKNKDGKVIAAIEMTEDITERKKAVEEQAESEEKFRNIFYESPFGIELLDSEGKIISMNSAIKEIFGLVDPSQLLGKFSLLDDPNVPDEVKSSMRQGKTIRYESVFNFDDVKKHNYYETTKSGTGHLEYAISPLCGVSDKVMRNYIVQIIDITERKKAEGELKNKLKELEQFHELACGREMKIIEMKKQVNAMSRELGRLEPYE
ncbi:MAG: PAS domain S-box protein [PVC group bacterium]|nr:PAS domain S-box protein [PVC group bacterium]